MATMSDAMKEAMHAARELGGSASALNEGEQLLFASSMKAAFASATASSALPRCVLLIKSANTSIEVTIQGATKTDSGRAKISYAIKTPLGTREISITTEWRKKWMDDDLFPIFRIINPIDFHITCGNTQEHYTYDDWVENKMAVHKVFEKHGAPPKRRRVECDCESDHDEPEYCGCGCNELRPNEFWNMPITRFCALVNQVIWDPIQ